MSEEAKLVCAMATAHTCVFAYVAPGQHVCIAETIARNTQALMQSSAIEITALRAERSTFDCRYAGQYWEASGSHCPIDRKCMRCRLERAEEELSQRREHMRRGIKAGRSTGGEG